MGLKPVFGNMLWLLFFKYITNMQHFPLQGKDKYWYLLKKKWFFFDGMFCIYLKKNVL